MLGLAENRTPIKAPKATATPNFKFDCINKRLQSWDSVKELPA